MELDSILQIALGSTAAIAAFPFIEGLYNIAYMDKIKSMIKQGKLEKEKAPYFAQELSDAAERTLEIMNKKSVLRGNLHYHFCEMPTLKAVYNFATLKDLDRALFFP